MSRFGRTWLHAFVVLISFTAAASSLSASIINDVLSDSEVPWFSPAARAAEPRKEAAERGTFATNENSNQGPFIETRTGLFDPIIAPPQTSTFLRSNSSKSKPTIRLRGRIDADAIGITQSPGNEATFGKLDSVAGLRRARVGVEGNFNPDARYVAEIDLASGDVVIRDLYLELGQIQDDGEFKFGHMREPFSLEGGTSANTFDFMERSTINVLDPARNWGAGYVRCFPGERSTFATGVFKSGVDANDFQWGKGSDSAVTSRVTWLPWYEEKGLRLMHLGMATSSRISDRGIVIVNQRPGSPLLDLGDSSTSPFIPKIQIPAAYEQLFNLEAAIVNGPFSAQAEWYGSLIDQIGGPPVFFHGGYASASYFVTGDHRSYLTHTGLFGPVSVAKPVIHGFASHKQPQQLGAGAWELTTRMAYLDFFDVNTPLGPQGQLVGTRLPQFTTGINCYLADRLRIMFNYTYSVIDEPNTGTSSANAFATRFAVFW